MKRITVPYFSTAIKWASPLIMGAGIYVWVIGYPVWMLVFVLMTTIILTTKYVTEIDLGGKTCNDYLSFLWMPFEEEKLKFDSIDRIIIVKENHSQIANTRSRSRQLDWESFTGTLIFDETKTLDLLTKNDKRELLLGLKEFAEYFKVEVEDRTTKQYFLIDLSKI